MRKIEPAVPGRGPPSRARRRARSPAGRTGRRSQAALSRIRRRSQAQNSGRCPPGTLDRAPILVRHDPGRRSAQQDRAARADAGASLGGRMADYRTGADAAGARAARPAPSHDGLRSLPRAGIAPTARTRLRRDPAGKPAGRRGGGLGGARAGAAGLALRRGRPGLPAHAAGRPRRLPDHLRTGDAVRGARLRRARRTGRPSLRRFASRSWPRPATAGRLGSRRSSDAPGRRRWRR